MQAAAPPAAAARDVRVWVGIRLRPLSDAERARRGAADRGALWRAAEDAVTLELQPPAGAAAPPPGVGGVFDRVFAADASAADVARAAISPLVAHVLAGVSCTVFAFGPTGGGKTYTMQQAAESVTDSLFATLRETPNREFLLRVSAVELYNEARAVPAVCTARRRCALCRRLAASAAPV
jgi:centromeric protein E